MLYCFESSFTQGRPRLVVTHFVSRFLYFLHSIFRKAVYAKLSSEPLATIEQYRISFNRNTKVVNDHFIREGHL